MSRKNYPRTPEDVAKANERALRRAAQEQLDREKAAAARKATEARLQGERALPAYTTLRKLGNLGVVALEGSNMEYLLQGLKTCVDKAKGHMVALPSEGNIQGSEQDMEQGAATLTAISQLRRSAAAGARVLAFTDFDFRDTASTGTPAVRDRVIDLIEGGTADGVSVLLVGPGDLDDLPHSSHFDRQQHPVAQSLALHFGLDADGELSVAPELRSPAHVQDPESLLSFAHLLPASIQPETT